jgi:subtilisin family serine protease
MFTTSFGLRRRKKHFNVQIINMYKVKYGGKNGKTVSLEESPDLVAIRTKGNTALENTELSGSARHVVQDSVEVAKFPEAGITVRKISADEAAGSSADLESSGSGRRELSGPPDTSKRDAARATLKQEDNIRFAGRVLQDKESGEVMLYTENFFVKFYDTTKEKDCLDIIEKYQLTVKNKLPFAPNAYFVCASEGTGLKVFEIAEAILKEKVVEYCHPELVQERRFKLIHPKQWHLTKTSINGKTIDQHVNIEGAWKLTRGKGITVAVVDDGVDMDHPEFKGRIVHPFDATANVPDAGPKSPDDNHGTACAGMACASGLKDGASGTAPEAFLMPIRLRSGLGSMAEANAFAWAADQGADVISCSWGPTDGEWWNPSDATHNRSTVLPDSTRLAMEYALTKGRKGKGCIILFAAGNGNESTQNDGYVSYPGVIAVAACNDSGKRSVYSDYGKAVWVSFPSGDFGWKAFKHPAPVSEGLRTTDRMAALGYQPEHYTNTFGGTSGACPGMAGVVALMLSANPNLTAVQVKDLVRHSCVQIDTAEGEYNAQGHSEYYGYGRIDAQKAVENAKKVASNAAAGPLVEGSIKFGGKNGTMALQHDVLMGGAKQRLLGVTLKCSPALKNLSLRYKVNASGTITEGVDGSYAGANTGRQRVLGFSIMLEGTAAKQYTIQYAARVEGQTEPITAKDGAFCGSDKKTGKSIEAIIITLKKK